MCHRGASSPPGRNPRCVDRSVNFPCARLASVSVLAPHTTARDLTSITRTGGYRISVRIAANGSAEADGTGGLYAYDFAGDPGELGAGLPAINGHVHESYAADGTFLGNTFDGTSYDLCDALA